MALTDVFDLIITGTVRGGLYALMAVGLALVFGVMNVSNFAHGEFYMIGAYAAFLAFGRMGLPPLLAIATAGVAGFITGAVIERVVFNPLRRKTEEWVMNSFLVTAGLSFMIQNVAFLIWGGRYWGIDSYWKTSLQITPSLRLSLDRVMSFCIAFIAIGALWLFLRRTQIGRAIRAVSQDERGAMLVGINLDRVHTLTFGLSGLLASIAGGGLLSLTQAHPTVGSKPLISSWFVVILVGLGNVRGAIVGGLIVGLMEATSYYFLGSGWQNVVSLCVLITILLFKPSGIFGTEVKGALEE
jgi:branched-chain amino acid transport system permease protein